MTLTTLNFSKTGGMWHAEWTHGGEGILQIDGEPESGIKLSAGLPGMGMTVTHTWSRYERREGSVMLHMQEIDKGLRMRLECESLPDKACVRDSTSELILDEESETPVNAVEGTGLTVKVKRSGVKKDIYNTFVLPFSLSTAQIAAAFGEGTKVYAYGGLTDDPNLRLTEVTDGMDAGQCYVVVPIADPPSDSVYVFEDIDSVVSAAPEPAYGSLKFHPSYGKIYALPEGCYLFSSGQLYHSNVSVNTMKGFRWYFTYPPENIAGLTASSTPLSAVTLDQSSDGHYNQTVIESCAKLGLTVSVTLKRTFGAGVWNSLCLPFNVTDIAGVFGEGTEVSEYTSIEGKTLHFTKVTSIEAGKPYLFKPGGDSPASEYIIANVSQWETEPLPVTYNGVTMKGFYCKTTVPAGAYTLGTGGLVYHLQEPQEANGFRAYIEADTDINGYGEPEQ